jgi:mannose-1-phosphate guanylyltransferase/phosphomannomutase
VAFAGEPDGGYLFPAFAPFMDAMMSTAKLMEFLAREGKGLGHFLGLVPKPALHMQSVPCTWELKGTIMRRLLEETEGEERELIDGVKIHRDGAAVMVLPDADRAAFHVSAEAETVKAAKDLVARFVDKIRAWQR